MTKIIAVAALLLLPAISRAQAVTGRTQIAFTADRIPATTASEALFSLTLSTFNTNGATLGGAAVNMYTITRGKSLNITNVFFGVESGGSAPAASRVAIRARSAPSSSRAHGRTSRTRSSASPAGAPRTSRSATARARDAASRVERSPALSRAWSAS